MQAARRITPKVTSVARAADAQARNFEFHAQISYVPFMSWLDMVSMLCPACGSAGSATSEVVGAGVGVEPFVGVRDGRAMAGPAGLRWVSGTLATGTVSTPVSVGLSEAASTGDGALAGAVSMSAASAKSVMGSGC